MPRNLTNLDLDLVRSFAVIAEQGSFTRAADRIGRQQSTISLQLRRLEDTLGQKLLERTPHQVRLTPAGEAFLDHAHRILDLNDEIVARIQEPDMEGAVRLGTPEDFATRHLPGVLSRFAQAYPSVTLEVTCDLTLNLMTQFRENAFDLVLVKREPSMRAGGIKVWREPLVWVEGDHSFWADARALPLVVSPAPCVYRKRAQDTLTRARRQWRVSYTCGSLAGSIAAVKAGLGITVLPKDMVPPDLHIVGENELPDLKDTEIALLQTGSLTRPAQRLRDHIVRCLG